MSSLSPPADPTWLGVPDGPWPTGGEAQPFVRYRRLLDSYRAASELGWSDQQFVDLIERLDAAVHDVCGVGFSITPVTDDRSLAEELGHRGPLWVKDETGNVGGSHKARHLFGLALHHTLDPATAEHPLAISSCGNAALAAAIIASAAQRELRVFVPPWAEPSVLEELHHRGAVVETCHRQPGELGDPCYRRFEQAVAAGALPFGCQGPAEPRTLDGGRTLGWELVDQLDRPDRVIVQVGGGAFGSSVAQAFAGAVALGQWPSIPRFDTVQTEGCAPLAAAMSGLDGAIGSDPAPNWVAAAASLMQPWPAEPQSLADGILDDVTYDWLVLAWAMRHSGGAAIVAPEALVERAHHAARSAGWAASATGTAGGAGLLTAPAPELATALVMSGVERG